MDTNITKNNFMETVRIIDKLNRTLPEYIRYELEKLEILDVTGIQAMIVYRIGDKTITVGEVMKGGYYQGSNSSYNLRRLTENGYLGRGDNAFDGRYSLVYLTDKGMGLWNLLDSVIMPQANKLTSAGIGDNSIRDILFILNKINDTLLIVGKK
jgi:DNA-binding MarR family transcriptional regulator